MIRHAVSIGLGWLGSGTKLSEVNAISVWQGSCFFASNWM